MNSTQLLADCVAADARFINELMEKVLGQRRTSLQFKVPFGIIYSLLLLLGVCGNLFTCFVIARTKCLHTATNLYLFSLAVSDLALLLAGLPHELYSILVIQYPWQFNTQLCRIRNFLAELTPAVSVMTITCFTVERYIAIAHPLRAQILSSFKRTLLIILSIWALGCLVCSPVAFASSPTAYVAYPNATQSPTAEMRGCPQPAWANSSGMPVPQSVVCNCADAAYCATHFQVSSFAFFVVPMCIITVLYLLIAVALNRSNSLAASGRRNDSGDARSRSSLVRMLVVIVVTFFVCWAPFHFQRLLAIYGVLQYVPAAITNALYFCSGSLFYVSSTLNPVFYNLMSAKFRQGSRSVFCCCAGGDGAAKLRGNKCHAANTTVSRTNGVSPSPSCLLPAAAAANQRLLPAAAAANQQLPSPEAAPADRLRVCSVQLVAASGGKQPIGAAEDGVGAKSAESSL